LGLSLCFLSFSSSSFLPSFISLFLFLPFFLSFSSSSFLPFFISLFLFLPSFLSFLFLFFLPSFLSFSSSSFLPFFISLFLFLPSFLFYLLFAFLFAFLRLSTALVNLVPSLPPSHNTETCLITAAVTGQPMTKWSRQLFSFLFLTIRHRLPALNDLAQRRHPLHLISLPTQPLANHQPPVQMVAVLALGDFTLCCLQRVFLTLRMERQRFGSNLMLLLAAMTMMAPNLPRLLLPLPQPITATTTITLVITLLQLEA
jgi:hypothetical protein